MKKEFLLLSALISCAIFVYLIYPISDLKQLDKQNVSEKNMVDTLQTNELTQNKDNIDLTFDIVRLDKTGDVVIAGKTIPNIKVDILDGNEILASVFSDSNGDWVWISENPLPEGIKRFNLKHFDGEHEFFSHQNIIILREKNNDLDNKQQSQKQAKGRLSPEQVKSLLDAMNNQEKKVQDKINAKKIKGVPLKSAKDW